MTLALRVRTNDAFFGSLVVTVMVLLTWPFRWVVSTAAETLPSPPGRIFASNCVTVHPQPALAERMDNSALPEFLTLNANSTFLPFSTSPAS